MSRHDYYCWLDDEAEGRQYHVRLTYEMEGRDPGDWTTPPCSPAIQLTQLAVLQAREFDANGDINCVEFQNTAQCHIERAWQLVQENATILARLEEDPASL